MDAGLSHALQMEFQALRASIRQDLQEELHSALAPLSVGHVSRPSSRQESQESPPRRQDRQESQGSVSAWESSRHVGFNLGRPASDDVEVLRISAKGDDMGNTVDRGDGWEAEPPGVLQLHIPTELPPQRKVGFVGEASGTTAEIASLNVPQDDVVFEVREKGNFLHESVMAAAKRAKSVQAPPPEPKKLQILSRLASRKSGTLDLIRNRLSSSVVSRVSGKNEEGNAKSRPSSKHHEEVLKWEEVFELIALVAIVINGFVFGAQTEYQAVHRTEDLPVTFIVMELIFFCIFTVELVLRLSREHSQFCLGPNSKWNCFDAFLVCLQVIDLMLETTQLLKDTANISFLRLLRILRILRVLRLVRLVRFFGELNVVTSAIANSIKSLTGTLMLLLLIIYMFSIAFAGAANSYLIRLKEDGVNIQGNPVDVWWGSLGRTVLSLYESILGGVDWDDLMQGLLEIHAGWAILFMSYISFMMLTMLNVITGIFVDSAVKHAAHYHEKAFATQMRRLFVASDTDDTGSLTRDKFEAEMQKPGFAWFMQEVGIEPREARLLFDLLDLDKSNDIELEEFLAGMVRLRAGARFIDIMNLQHVFEQQQLSGEPNMMTKTRSSAATVMMHPGLRGGSLLR